MAVRTAGARRGLRDTILAELGALAAHVEVFPATQTRSIAGAEVFRQSISLKDAERESLVAFLDGVSSALSDGHCLRVQFQRQRQKQPGLFDPATVVLWDAKLEFVQYGPAESAVGVPPPVDAVAALGEILEVLDHATSAGQVLQLDSIDLRLATKSSPDAGPCSGETSRVTLTADELDSGDRLSRLFDARRIWEASPAVVARGGKMRVTLTLRPKESYLRSLGE